METLIDGKTPHLFNTNTMSTPSGNLSFLESINDLGFHIKRVYYLYNIQEGEERGHHAHKNLQQCLIALSGSFEIEIEKQGKKFTHILDNRSKALYIPAGCYRILRKFSKGSVCLVLASDFHDESDYIRDYSEFLEWEKSKNIVSSVPFAHLYKEYKFLQTKIDSAYDSVMKSQNFILGNKLKEFENKFAEFCGAKHAIGVASGLDALKLSLHALGVGKDDEVIIPSHTFVATALAVSSLGAKPIFADIDIGNYTIDVKSIESKISKHTKAIIVVHMHGLPCDMDKIMSIAKTHDLKVIEDCAQAHGAKYRNKVCGNIGDISAFSFYPTKNLGCYGDGGMITTNDSHIAEKIKIVRNYGSNERYNHMVVGENSRLDELQAAFLLEKLKYLEEFNSMRHKLAQRYLERLSSIKSIILPLSPESSTHVWHHFVIRVQNKSIRSELINHLSSNSISTVIHYPKAIHQQPIYNKEYKDVDLKNTELFADTALSLPISHFHTLYEIDFVSSKIKEFFA